MVRLGSRCGCNNLGGITRSLICRYYVLDFNVMVCDISQVYHSVALPPRLKISANDILLAYVLGKLNVRGCSRFSVNSQTARGQMLAKQSYRNRQHLLQIA